jgi:hypothetical protein
MAGKEILRQPERDCVYCGDKGCRALRELYCAIELKKCPFYKSKDDYYEDGNPREK